MSVVVRHLRNRVSNGSASALFRRKNLSLSRPILLYYYLISTDILAALCLKITSNSDKKRNWMKTIANILWGIDMGLCIGIKKYRRIKDNIEDHTHHHIFRYLRVISNSYKYENDIKAFDGEYYNDHDPEEFSTPFPSSSQLSSAICVFSKWGRKGVISK